MVDNGLAAMYSSGEGQNTKHSYDRGTIKSKKKRKGKKCKLEGLAGSNVAR